jgi:plasmid maintenance system antidote protein VapI
LAEADFSATVMRKVKALKNVTCAEISEQAGLVPTYIKTIFADQYRFPCKLKPEDALRLDSILGHDGEVFLNFVATDQQSAYQAKQSILDEIFHRTSFGRIF